MSLIARCTLFATLSLAACASSQPPRATRDESATARAPDVTVSETGRDGPIRAALSGPKTPSLNAPFELVLSVERRFAISVPVSIDVKTPSAVRMTHGKSRMTLDPSGGPHRDELRYTLHAAVMPSEDLVVVIDAHGAGFGYHAELPYRFGRPAPVPHGPDAGGPELRVGNKNLGRSVELGGSQGH